MSAARTLAIDFKKPFSTKELENLYTMLWGKSMPHDEQVEKNVIGNIINLCQGGNNQPFRKVRFLQPEDFYKAEHQIIWEAILNLAEIQSAIDLLTLTHELKRTNKLDEVGGPFYLTECSNSFYDITNTVSHARIIYDHSMRRDAIYKACEVIVSVRDNKKDIYDTRNEFAQQFKVIPPTSFFKVSSMSSALEEGMNSPAMLKIAGNIWRTSEISFLFAEPGTGKSILGMQIADAATRGAGIFEGICDNEIGEPMKILYYDFELLPQELYERYSDQNGTLYQFNDEMMIRASESDDYIEKKQNKSILDFIEDNIEVVEPQGVIIDNITWLTNESSHDTDIALSLMKRIKRINKKTHMPFLILAHSVKRINKTQPLTMADMGGSTQLLNFATNVVGMAKSATDSDLLYIKQVKQRNGQAVFNEENVIVCTITKQNNFLQLQCIGLESERNHLASWNSTDAQEEIIEKAVELRASSDKGWETIKKEIKWPGSKNTLKKRCEEWAEGSLTYELAPNGEIVRASGTAGLEDYEKVKDTPF